MSTDRHFSRLHDRVSPVGPGTNPTFKCACCGQFKLAAGRRKVARQWHCKGCFENQKGKNE